MRRLAAFARKMASLARRLRSTSASGRPLPGSAGRAAPGYRKRSKAPADSGDKRCTAETQTSRGPFPAAAGKIGTGGRKVHSQSRVASKGAEVLKSPPSFADALSASSTSAPSTSLGPLHPPPHADRDFWFKFMMLGGSSLGFVIHLLKGYVDKEVELKMKGKEAEDRAKIIKEKEKELEAKKQELELKKQELEIATEEKKRSAWFWH